MKKMILVPSEMTSHTKPIDFVLTNLDSEMSSILQRDDIPIDVKLRQYNQILHKYGKLDNMKKQPYELDIIEPTNNTIRDSDVLQGIPIKNEKAAHALWDFVKRNDRIQIADKGEVILDGRKMLHTNIIDMIHDLSRDRKTQKPANGIEEFVKILKESNLPREYVINKNRYVINDEIASAASFTQWTE